MTAFIDLSHPIVDGMTTYPGLAGPNMRDVVTRSDSLKAMEEKASFSIRSIEMVANTGTYLDTPHHRFDGGHDLSELDLARIADLAGIVIQSRGPRLTPSLIEGLDLKAKAVLFLTGWSAYFGTEEYGDDRHPYVSADLAEALVNAEPALVGIDSVNIDNMGDLARPAHTGLLAAGIPIVEHLTHLDRLPAEGFRFFAVPPLVVDFGTFPVRAFAVVD